MYSMDVMMFKDKYITGRRQRINNFGICERGGGT
jgi:hypothetical protein